MLPIKLNHVSKRGHLRLIANFHQYQHNHHQQHHCQHYVMVECRYNAPYYTMILFAVQQFRWHALVKTLPLRMSRGPPLVGEPWDVYFWITLNWMCRIISWVDCIFVPCSKFRRCALYVKFVHLRWICCADLVQIWVKYFELSCCNSQIVKSPNDKITLKMLICPLQPG